MAGLELKGWTVAVVGGDLRMLEHMRGARAAGAMVQHYGSVPGAEAAAGRPQAASLADALKGAAIISCPIPGVGEDASLFAKYTDEKLLMTRDVLAGAAPGALMFTYCNTPQLLAWARARRSRSWVTAQTMSSASFMRSRPPKARSKLRSKTPTRRCSA